LKALKADLQERDLIHVKNDIEKINFNNRSDAASTHSRKRKRRRLETSDQPRRKKHRSRANVSINNPFRNYLFHFRSSRSQPD
jgi:hypothetical protein